MHTSGSEGIKPYGDDSRCKTEQVRAMFDNIAPAYDFMNRMMTLGIDKLWRRKAVNMLRRSGCHLHILDVATGTGDLAMLLARRLRPSTITGIDLSDNMIGIARHKAEAMGDGVKFDFRVADCLSLPFADGAFDCVTVAYGVRNFERLLDGYKEMYRVMASGGVICVIELSTPVGRVVRPLYDFYTRCIIPIVGRMVSNDTRAYSYLPESIEAVAQGSDMTALMSRAGFRDARFRRLTFGVCTIYTAVK